MSRQESPDKPSATEEGRARANKPDRKKSKEIGGPKGPEPTRYGDWEKAGRCYDF